MPNDSLGKLALMSQYALGRCNYRVSILIKTALRKSYLRLKGRTELKAYVVPICKLMTVLRILVSSCDHLSLRV